MKKYYIILGLLVFCFVAQGQVDYNKYFTDQCLRIDYFHSGSQSEEFVVIDEMYRLPEWSGNPAGLIDTLNLGTYQVKVFDAATSALIYSTGFNTLFNEWQTTNEALHGGKKIMSETVRIPFPRREIQVDFLRRDDENHFTKKISTWIIDPASPNIRKENRAVGTTVYDIQNGGDYQHKADLAILAEGYTADEAKKFESDARRLSDILFGAEPFKKHRKDFNVYAVFKPSSGSGPDNPRLNEYHNTVLNSSFNTFGSQRYLMTFDNKDLQDMASAVPFDVVYILVNSKIYGGGGIYNLYACCVADNELSNYIFLHEFGHSFGGLGDEYYTSDVAYNEFYPENVEPWEPNLTVLLDPKKVKWSSFMDANTPVPTPWNKKEYDEENEKYSETFAELKGKPMSAPSKEIKKIRSRHHDWIENFFNNHPYHNKVGVFEGAGYASNGIYRPSLDCIMFSARNVPFDPVCRAAIEKRIRFFARQ
ncbi:MAG: M64 family metallopeptidase [Calditrichia bacterium]